MKVPERNIWATDTDGACWLGAGGRPTVVVAVDHSFVLPTPVPPAVVFMRPARNDMKHGRPSCQGWQSFSFIQTEQHRQFSRQMLRNLGNLSLAELSRLPKTGGWLAPGG